MKLTHLFEGDSQFRLYCDLDGVLFDFIGGASEAFGYTVDEKLLDNDSKARNKFWKQVTEYSESGGELWRNLETLPDATELWDFISEFNLTILTAAGDPKFDAARQKRACVKDHFGDIPVIVTESSRAKAQYAEPGSILIDDRRKSIDPWVAAGGIGIHHTSAADSIKQLTKILEGK